MKKMLLATALALLLQDVLNRRLLFKTNHRVAAAPKETITHRQFLELGRRKLSAQPKFAGAENVVKTETCANIRKWIVVGFITGESIYTRQRVYCFIIIA